MGVGLNLPLLKHGNSVVRVDGHRADVRYFNRQIRRHAHTVVARRTNNIAHREAIARHVELGLADDSIRDTFKRDFGAPKGARNRVAGCESKADACD